MTELARLQKAFTEHLRNPDVVQVPPGLDPRRVGVYSELIFNNLSALLTEFFPVIKGIVGEAHWRRLIRDFFISHQAETPYFPKLSEEFVHYLSSRQMQPEDPGFLLELAHYEWVELHLFWHEQDPPDSPLPEDELAQTPIRLSPVAEPIAYEYPVHRIGPDYLPDAPGEAPTFLLVFRDTNESVRFFELQPLTFEFLEALQDNPGLRPGDWLDDIGVRLGVADPASFQENGLNMLKQFNAECVFERSDE